MFQGVFDVLMAEKIVSDLRFGKCSRFHISNIVWDVIPHLGTFTRKALFSYLGLGTCSSRTLLVSYFSEIL